MSIILGLDDIKPSSYKRIVQDMIYRETERSKPLHKRKKGERDDDEDDATAEADEENDKLVALDRERGEPNDVELDDEDMSEEAMSELTSMAKSKKKTAKKKKA